MKETRIHASGYNTTFAKEALVIRAALGVLGLLRYMYVINSICLLFCVLEKLNNLIEIVSKRTRLNDIKIKI